jgi:hypothetical protein
MDNCSIHLDPRVKKLIEGVGAILIYSAPYTPELIPIEYMFHNWKSYLKRNMEDFKRDWYTVHLAGLASIKPQMGLNFFKNTGLVDLVREHPMSKEYQEAVWADIEMLEMLSLL